jgi:hypothetical protein
MHRTMMACVLACALLSSAGCGGEPEAEAKGTVILDGAPLKDGTIYFILPTAGSKPVTAAVANGEFSVRLPVGKYRVEIRRPEKISAPDGKELGPTTRETISAAYNAQSRLVLEVPPGGASNVRYDVTSQ